MNNLACAGLVKTTPWKYKFCSNAYGYKCSEQHNFHINPGPKSTTIIRFHADGCYEAMLLSIHALFDIKCHLLSHEQMRWIKVQNNNKHMLPMKSNTKIDDNMHKSLCTPVHEQKRNMQLNDDDAFT